jgi:hypothetical protein
MEAKVSGKNIVIKLDIDTLVTAFNYKEDNQGVYKVKYKRKFAECLALYLHDEMNSSETELTVFQEMLDQLFEYMVDNEEDCIKELEEEEH